MDSECPVCKEFLADSETPVKELPCGHLMHARMFIRSTRAIITRVPCVASRSVTSPCTLECSMLSSRTRTTIACRTRCAGRRRKFPATIAEKSQTPSFTSCITRARTAELQHERLDVLIRWTQ